MNLNNKKIPGKVASNPFKKVIEYVKYTGVSLNIID
jgi:hypothetical protein